MNAPLRIQASWHAGRLGPPQPRLARPQVARLLVGLPVEAAIARLGGLFALCVTAQTAAARAALASAQAQPLPETAGWRLGCEAVQEWLWRLWLDWPAWAGCEPARAEFAHLYRQLAGARDAEAAARAGQAVSEALPATLSATTAHPLGVALGRLLALCADSPGPAPALLPPDHPARGWAQALNGQVPDAAFCRQPHWQGQPAETGALARQATDPDVAARLAGGQALAARLLAQWLEARRWAAQLAGAAPAAPLDAVRCAPGIGLARVETARGPLLHVARVCGGRVDDYAIVAPTEWNLHPRGALAALGMGLPASGTGQARSALTACALALNPCVPFEVDPVEDSGAATMAGPLLPPAQGKTLHA